ncbi:MAG: NigD-like C-terminal domain-containing protein [Bacteroidia bacterium]|nr:NigD-like C-terminal domain-containing protein [Bacteroidia bacterium]
MKRFVEYLSLALAVLLCAGSCMDVDSPISTGTVICNVINSIRLQDDAGEYLNIVETAIGTIPDTIKRAMINCDVLVQHEDDANEYDIRLLEYAPVTIAEPVLASGTSEEELGSDALDISLWGSGGYLNSFTSFTSLKDSDTEHEFNLVLDDTRSGADTLYLRFTHNAFGESYDNPDADVSKIQESGKYFSYDLDKFIPSGQQSIVLYIEYESFVTSSSVILRDKETKSGYLKFNR